MRLPPRKWRWFGLALGLALVGFVAIRTWVVPAILLRQVEAQYHGKVVFRDWWFGLRSSGVTGVQLHESASDDSPIWFSSDRISTDVSLARLIRGRLMPTRITIDHPKVIFRLDAAGQPLTKIPVGSDAAGPKAQADFGSLPDIVATGGELTLDQQGRKPMTIRGVDARLAPALDGGDLTVTTDDPTWGQVKIAGHFDPSFKNGSLEIKTSPGFVADPEKLARIPFIPADVWSNIEPRGPVDARVKIDLALDSPKPVTVHTDITLKDTAAKLNSLQIETTDTTGHVVIDDAVVKLEDLRGKAIDGSIHANGTLDFSHEVPRFDLDLRLRGVDVTKAPPSWQLGEVGATGRLSGRVDLKVGLEPSSPDLTGTAGRAVIEDGSFQGIPIKSLSLGLKADRNDLQYETMPEGSVDKNDLERPTAVATTPDGAARGTPSAKSDRVEIWEPVAASLPLLELASHGHGVIGWAAFAVQELVTYQVKHGSGNQGGAIRLPKTISTRIELEDVDLATILAKAKKFGIEVPVPVAGKFSIKATATIPLGSLKDLKAYAFKGDATLKAASIDHVDLGSVSAHLELARGLLDLSDLRGQFVDRPAGDDRSPPRPTATLPIAGPLPPGGFRGNLRASISPPGTATAKFEGDHLPLGELFAPVLPVPTPLSGELTLLVAAKADLGKLSDPKTWSLEGHVDSRRVKYLDAVLDEVQAKVVVKDGRLDVSEFAARLLGRPLKATAGLDLAPPHRYDGKVDVEGWEIAQVLGFVPGIPRPSPASGKVDARGEAEGTLLPFAIATKGAARVLEAKVGKTPVGNLGFRWTTDREWIEITGLELFAYGGRATGEARIPTKPGRSIEASANLKGIDAGRLASAIPGQGLKLAGKADGKLKLTMPLDASAIDGDLTLLAPDLKVSQGDAGAIAVRSLRMTAVARKGKLDYEATAEALSGKARFHGSAPISGNLADAVGDGELLAVGFRLGEVWKGLGMGGGLSHLDGLAAFDANIRTPLQPFQLLARGNFELRDLRYTTKLPLGNLKGVASLGPTGWRVEELAGDLMGGLAAGSAHGETSPGGSKVIAFDFKVDRASLSRMASAVPSLARQVEGYGSLRLAGRVSDNLQANAELLVPRAKFYGVPLTDLRLPLELEMNPATGAGSIHARHWTGRVAGGSVRGSAWHRLGEERTFQSDIQLNGVDIEVISRAHSISKRSASGKISGKVTLSGPNPDQMAKVRGKVDLNLDDASLVEMPVFKELDRFLGSARGGGLFEDGDVHGTIFNRTLFVEQMTLNGRLIQVHATGTVTFDGGLNLEVLVNTNQVIPQSGLALINVIPGLGQALGRGEETLLRLANFLENRLLKFRVTGTADNPTVRLDPGVAVGDTAVGFFSAVLKVPLGIAR